MCGFYRLWYKTSISKFLKSILLRLGLARRWHSPRSTTPKKVHLSACHLRSDKRNRGCNRKLQCFVLGCINKSSVACSPLPEKGRQGQVLVCNKTHLTSSENRSHESKNQRLSTIIRIQFSNAHLRPDSNQSINLRDLYAETGQTLQGSFSAVSKPNFARKYAFESSPRDLQLSQLPSCLTGAGQL